MTLFKKIFIFGFSSISIVFSQNEILKISFFELAEYAEQKSISFQQLKEELNREEFHRKQDLSWTNPALDYSQERINNETEHSITLNKQIEFPWVYVLRKKRRDAQLSAAQSNFILQKNQFITVVKSDYCKIKMMEIQVVVVIIEVM